MRRETPQRIRQPAVSGIFYPDQTDILRRIISECFKESSEGLSCAPYGIVCPHAGYVYSGAVAAHGYGAVADRKPPYAILVGPNHRGDGPAISLSGHTHWETPLGASPVLYHTDMAACGAIRDARSHTPEHSLEVQVPMIQYLWGMIPISPILISDQSQETAKRLGGHLGCIDDGPLVVASSDLTHYTTEERARRQDAEIIDAITRMDTDAMYRYVEGGTTACGYGAIAAVMEYSRARGATSGVLLKYDTSANVSGDRSNVVGYAAVAFC